MRRAGNRLLLGLAAIALLLSPVFRNGFVYDDDAVIERGDYIHDPRRIPEFFLHPAMYVSVDERDQTRDVDTYRPLTLVTFSWDSWISGRKPWSYHLTNLLAHLACVALVHALAWRMLGRDRRDRRVWAAVAAAWFALSPLPQAAHIWINGRSDVFCVLFGLSSILLWLRAKDEPRSLKARLGLAFAAAVLWFAALLCKEIWIGTLPALIFWPARPTRDSRVSARLIAAAPLALASAVYLAVRSAVLHGLHAHHGPGSLYLAAARIGVLCWDGLLNTWLPLGVYLRCMYYDYRQLPPYVLALGWVALAAVVWWLWRMRERTRVQLWGAVWFIGTLAPAAMISTLIWPGFGRYLYVPSIGLSIAGSAALAALWEAQPTLRRLGCIAAIVYSAVLVVRLEGWIADYRSAETLYAGIIAADPESPHGWGWLGISRHRRGDFQGAVGPLERALERDEGRPLYLEPLADAYLRLGRTQQAMAAALTGLRYGARPNYRMIIVNITHATQPALAARQIAECLRESPNEPSCRAAFVEMTSGHARADEYRTLFATLAQREGFAFLRRSELPR